jgi:hypothetical protein
MRRADSTATLTNASTAKHLRASCFGQRYFRSRIRLDGKRSEGASLLNLVEAQVLAVIRRVHGVPMHRVRPASEYVRKERVARHRAAHGPHAAARHDAQLEALRLVPHLWLPASLNRVEAHVEIDAL